MIDETRDYRTVTHDTWQKMLRLAHNLDISRGGLYDARSGCINLWVSPEDHPPCWAGVPITRGTDHYHREYLGGIYGRHTEDFKDVVLKLEVTAYQRQAERQMGEYPPPEEDEWEWLQKKGDELLEQVELLIEPPGSDSSIFCRFCDAPVRVALVNDFLSHLKDEHNVKIHALVIEDHPYVLTNVGRIEL